MLIFKCWCWRFLCYLRDEVALKINFFKASWFRFSSFLPTIFIRGLLSNISPLKIFLNFRILNLLPAINAAVSILKIHKKVKQISVVYIRRCLRRRIINHRKRRRPWAYRYNDLENWFLNWVCHMHWGSHESFKDNRFAHEVIDLTLELLCQTINLLAARKKIFNRLK